MTDQTIAWRHGGRGGGVTGGRIILHQRHNGDVCDKCRKMTSTGNVRGINPGKERADIKQKQRLLPLKDKQRIPAVPALSLGGPSITFIRKKKNVKKKLELTKHRHFPNKKGKKKD